MCNFIKSFILRGPDTNQELLKFLYTENAKLAHLTYEWRHKVILLYLSSVGAIFFFFGWLYDHQTLNKLIPIPFILGTLVSYILFYMDEVNHRVMSKCDEIGMKLEKKLEPTGEYIYTYFDECNKVEISNQTKEQSNSYYLILKNVYFYSGLISLIFAFISILVVLLFPSMKPDGDLKPITGNLSINIDGDDSFSATIPALKKGENTRESSIIIEAEGAEYQIIYKLSRNPNC